MISNRRVIHDWWVPLGVQFVGVLLITVGFAADLVSGVPGLGRVQIALIAFGVAVVFAGLLFLLPAAQARIRTMRMPEGEADPLGLIALVVWFGAIAGLLDPLILHAQNALGLRFEYVNQHMSWMSPVSYTALLLVFLVPLLLFGHGRLSWLPSRRTATTVLSFLVLVSLLGLFQPELHPMAAGLVALGVSAQVWRKLRGGGKGFRTFVSRTRVSVLLLLLLSVGLQVASPWASERYIKARIGAATIDQPNVILIVLDTTRGANVSVNGYPRATMDGVARRLASGGVVFERAIATTSWSLPSHVSLITGLFPHDFQADWRSPFNDQVPTLAETLGQHGYLTAGFFANKRFGGHQAGLDRGFHHWDTDVMTPMEVFGASHLGRLFLDPRSRLFGKMHNTNQFARKGGRQVTEEFSKWVGDIGEVPFFAFLNYMDAHAPHETPTGYEGHFADVARPETPFLGLGDPATAAAALETYDRSIAFLDDQIESILARLETLEKLDNTLVIVTSDHGEEFNERPGSQIGHGRSLAYAVVHVPLVLLWPDGLPADRRVSDFVSLRDLPATLLDLVGLADDHELGGASLRRFWAGTDAPRADRRGAPSFVIAELSARTWLNADSSPLAENAIALFDADLEYVRIGREREETL